jgi:sugar phosphate permease
MQEAERRVFAKIGWRLMPVLILAYVFNYLDRNNVGFAGLTMNQAIGLTATQLGFGAGVFFLAYCFLEVPSNIILYRVGARVWLSRIMISSVRTVSTPCDCCWARQRLVSFPVSRSISGLGSRRNTGRA